MHYTANPRISVAAPPDLSRHSNSRVTNPGYFPTLGAGILPSSLVERTFLFCITLVAQAFLPVSLGGAGILACVEPGECGGYSPSAERARIEYSIPSPNACSLLPPLPPGVASGTGGCPRAGWGEGKPYRAPHAEAPRHVSRLHVS